MDAISLIDDLENEFLDKTGYIKKKINMEKCVKLIGEMRKILPESLLDARRIVENKQKILQNADVVAKNTLRAAKQRAEDLSEESEIVRTARQRASEILSTAAAQRDALILKTKSHLDGMFEETEEYLLSFVAMIRKNRQELHDALS